MRHKRPRTRNRTRNKEQVESSKEDNVDKSLDWLNCKNKNKDEQYEFYYNTGREETTYTWANMAQPSVESPSGLQNYENFFHVKGVAESKKTTMRKTLVMRQKKRKIWRIVIVIKKNHCKAQILNQYQY